MRAALCIAVLAALALAAPSSASATRQTASSGAVTATMSYTKRGAFKYTGLRLAVVRAGQRVYDAPLTGPACGAPYCAPAGRGEGSALRVVDLDGDGEPEVIADVDTMGAHCCVISEVLRWDGSSGYRRVEHDWADPGYTLTTPAPPAVPEFVTADARFAYAFAPFGFSGMPVRVLRFTGGAFRDATREHPDTIAADARRWRREYMRYRRGKLSLGYLAAWVADEDLLGKGADAAAFVRAELHAGRLRSDQGWPQRSAFIRALERRLKAWGYAAG